MGMFGWISDAWDATKNTVNRGLDAAERLADKAINNPKAALNRMGEMASDAVSAVGDGVSSAYDATVEGVAAAGEWVADTAVATGEAIVEGAESAYDSTVEGVAAAGEWVADTASDAYNATVEGAQSAYDATVEGVAAAGEWVADTASDAYNATVEGVQSAYDSTVEGVAAAGEWVADTATDAYNATVEGVQAGAEAAVVAGATVVKGTINAARAGAELAESAYDATVEGVAAAGEWVADTATDAYNATVEGVQAGAEAAVVAGATVVKGTINAARAGAELAESAYNATVEGVAAAGEWVADTATDAYNATVEGVQAGAEAAVVAGATVVKGGINLARKGKEALEDSAERIANAPRNAEKWADNVLAEHKAKHQNISDNKSAIAASDTATTTPNNLTNHESAVVANDTTTATPNSPANHESAIAANDTTTATPNSPANHESAIAANDTTTATPQTVTGTQKNAEYEQKITDAYAKSRIVYDYNDTDHDYAKTRLSGHAKELNLTTNSKGKVTHKKTKVSKEQLDGCLATLKDMEEKGLLPRDMNGQSNAEIYMHRLVLANQMGGEHQAEARKAIKSLLSEKPDLEVIAKGVNATKGQTIDKKNAKYIASAGTQHSRITGDDGKEVDTETYVAKLREAQPQKGAIASTKTETKVSAPTTQTASAENAPQVGAPLLPEQKKDNLGATSKTSEEMTISAPQTPRDKHIFDTEQPEIPNYSEQFASNGPLTLSSYAMLQTSHTK